MAGRIRNDWITQGITIYYIINNPHMRAHLMKYYKIESRVIKVTKRQYYCMLIAKLDNQTKKLRI
jgi:hypothetical protein